MGDTIKKYIVQMRRIYLRVSQNLKLTFESTLALASKNRDLLGAVSNGWGPSLSSLGPEGDCEQLGTTKFVVTFHVPLKQDIIVEKRGNWRSEELI